MTMHVEGVNATCSYEQLALPGFGLALHKIYTGCEKDQGATQAELGGAVTGRRRSIACGGE